MPDVEAILNERFRHALDAAFGADAADADPQVRPSTNPRFGDYQANVAMGLGRRMKRPPADVAAAIVEQLQLADVCERVERAGPGFINLHLAPDFLARQLARLAADPGLGIAEADPAQTVVVDYSSPNVAKEMHVGHLRSSIIGDAIVRVLSAQGHRVIRQNHLGDWGTQFGMLIEHMLATGADDADRPVGDLNELYRAARQRFDGDAAFADQARRRVVALQGGDGVTLALWRRLVEASRHHFQGIYDRLGLRLTEDDVRGESFYNPMLPEVAADLERLGALEHSEGADVVFPSGFTDREGMPLPLIVRKRDGGYPYAATDLAAGRYRTATLGADRIVYVTGAPQAQHFAMVFAVLRRVGWAPPRVRLDHVAFGTVLGPDRRPFQTRSGETVRLVDLLDEAERRAAAVLEAKDAGLDPDQRLAIARTVGIGALKYADLSSDRIKDYVFDWQRMLALEGNTAPYLQNAYVRIRSIFRRGAVDASSLDTARASLEAAPERALAVKLMQMAGVVEAVSDSLEPHRLCTYLYELAALFHQFYERCPVLNADDAGTRHGRLVLCDLAARTLREGLGLLGIGVVERM